MPRHSKPRHIDYSVLDYSTLALLLAASCVADARDKPQTRAPEPIPCDVSRSGGCFDLAIDGQKVRQLDTPDGTAIYHGVDYDRHTRTSKMWFVPDPVSAQPKFVLHANSKTAQWLEGEKCIDVIVEQANPLTYHARRFALPAGEGSCNRPAANVRVEGGAVATVSISERTESLPPGDYVAFVRAYGSVHGWDGKTLFFTVGAR